MNQLKDPSTSRLCGFCGSYSLKTQNNLCPKCCQNFRSYHLLSQLCRSNNIQLKNGPPNSNQRMKGLLLYSFRGCTRSRLRKEHYSTFKILQTRELRTDLLKPAFRKTLKYVRRFKDLRKACDDNDIYQPRIYYWNYQIIRQLKSLRSLDIFLTDTLSDSMLKSVFLLGSYINPTNLTINFNRLSSIEYIFLLIRHMSKLRYLAFSPVLFPVFGSKVEENLSKCEKIIRNLPHLTEVSLGYSGGYKYLELIHTFLNHKQMRKIETYIGDISNEDLRKVFQNLSKIKELDCFRIETKFERFNQEEDQVILFDFLRSLKSINTFVLCNSSVGSSSKSEYVYPVKINNIKNVVIKEYSCYFMAKLMLVVQNVKSFEIDGIAQSVPLWVDIREGLLKHLNLENLKFKLDKSSQNLRELEKLPKIISFTSMKSISLCFSEISSVTIKDQLKIQNIIKEFEKHQKELKEINMQLSLPFDFLEFHSFLQTLANFSKLTILLKISEKLSLIDIDKIRDEIESNILALRFLTNFQSKIDPDGNLVLNIWNLNS